MDPFDRFALAVRDPARLLPLDEAALCVAAALQPGLDVETHLARLDDLAGSCPAPTLDSLARHLFGSGRFRGNQGDYYDPRNSLLDQVLDRGLGIPITLAVVAMEVGRRLGVPMDGVGMPGHFLLRDKVDRSVFVDPFHGGRFLDEAGCERLYRSVVGPGAVWDPSFLQPVSRPVIVARLLANLRQIMERTRDLEGLHRVVRLRLSMPEVGDDEAADLRRALAPLN